MRLPSYFPNEQKIGMWTAVESGRNPLLVSCGWNDQ
jgi:hypothetical protein